MLTLSIKFAAEKLFNAQKVRNCAVNSIFVGLTLQILIIFININRR